MTAIVIAYEVNCRLVDALDISKRGWDPSVFGLPAVALAAGRLMKLSAEQLGHAVNMRSTTTCRSLRPASARCPTGKGSRPPRPDAMRCSPHVWRAPA